LRMLCAVLAFALALIPDLAFGTEEDLISRSIVVHVRTNLSIHSYSVYSRL
jgi:hypothetical protein